nr:type 1 glutamine amidotransferase domain-containing protein [Pseudomonas typographi]
MTSHDQLGNTGLKTGFWLEEFAAPYYVFKDAGADIVLASPAGGLPPLYPKSDLAEFQTELTHRYKKDPDAQRALASTVELETVSHEDFDFVFYPGGHGPLWNLAESEVSIQLIQAFERAGKPIGFVCHAPGVLRRVKKQDGRPFVEGRHVTGFTNGEEADVQLTEIVPFLIEDEFRRQGGLYEKIENWAPHVVVDGTLMMGQNPASSEGVAKALLKLAQG